MLDSIRARLKRATDRRRQADRASYSVLASDSGPLLEGLVGEPVQELVYTRPQTADVSSLSSFEALMGNGGRMGVESQLREAKQRPKTSHSASRKRAEGRLVGKSSEVLSVDDARGWPLGNRRTSRQESALNESPLRISTMPLRDPLASPRTNQSAATSCDGKKAANKSSTAALQPGLKHRQPLKKRGDWSEERRAKTSHGNRRRSTEDDETTVSPRKRIQSARSVHKMSKREGRSPKEGQENIETLNTPPDGSSPYKPRADSRVSTKSRLHLVETAETSPRKRPAGSFKLTSALASALATSSGSHGSQESLVVQGNAQRKGDRNELVLKEGPRAGAAISKAKTRNMGDAPEVRAAKGVTSHVLIGAQQMEWRQKDPQTDMDELACKPARRKSEGDEVPQKTAVVLQRPRRRSLDSASAHLPTSSGSALAVPMHESSRIFSGSPVLEQGGNLHDASGSARVLVDHQSDDTCSPSTQIEHTADVSSLQQRGGSEAPRTPAMLVSRGANRPSTPSPFAIVSRKHTDETSNAGPRLAHPDAGRVALLSVTTKSEPLAEGCKSTDLIRKAGRPNPADALSSAVVRVSAERKAPEKRVKSEIDESELPDSSDESTGAAQPKYLRTEGPAESKGAPGEAAGEGIEATSAEKEDTWVDVRLDVTQPVLKDALLEGQQVEQQFVRECAALIACLDINSEALIQDICETAVLPVTPSPRFRADCRKATQSPRTPPKGSPRDSPRGPPRSPGSGGRRSPVSRLSPLWIPT